MNPPGRLLAHAGDIRYKLEQDRLFKDHILAESEEKIINLKDINGVNAPGKPVRNADQQICLRVGG